MRYLCIDTAVGATVAIMEKQECLTHHSTASARHHAERTTQLIRQCVHDCDAQSLADVGLDAIVVGTGPAPFTGLRAGLVTARTLGYSLNIPVYGMCSLDGVAYRSLCDGTVTNTHQQWSYPEGAPTRLHIPAGQSVLTLSDARRKEVYCAAYTCRDNYAYPLMAPTVLTPEDAVALAVEKDISTIIAAIANEDSCVWHADELPKFLHSVVDASPSDMKLYVSQCYASDLGQAWWARYPQRGQDGNRDTAPLYLRRPDIHGQPA
ncbi:MAG: tRNA (adenosine(37)-N6)-threonylcarbamoyltransferase complex dimerization subunit type 1 TsaB [Actinomycetaceae bacterium]|nr:tRNA (adenosine(37)-N6)-threonylcarbamoyltransferase complex dimerization subunit type 1 TsaB [Actinomycetaceae bacterium]